MDDTHEIDPRVEQINGNLQIIRQTDEAISAYLDGWLSEEAYAAALGLRDACREDVARLCAEIERDGGTAPVDAPARAGSPVPERVGTGEDALVELAELAAALEGTQDDIITAIMELAALEGGAE